MAETIELQGAFERIDVRVPTPDGDARTVALRVDMRDGAVARIEEFAATEAKRLDGAEGRYRAAVASGDDGAAGAILSDMSDVMGRALRIAVGEGYDEVLDALGADAVDVNMSMAQLFGAVMGIYARRLGTVSEKSAHYLSEVRDAARVADAR